MNLMEQLRRDERLSSSTRKVGAEIFRQIDPLTGRARVTAEQLADTLDVSVGTVRKAASTLTNRNYFRKIRVGRNVEYLPASGDRDAKSKQLRSVTVASLVE
jgi:predicted transcriptional regulator of viral defense system